MKSVAASLAFFLMVCVIVEALVEYYKTIYKMIENKKYKTAITQGVTIALGICAAFWFHLHLFNDVLSRIYPELLDNPINQIIDTVLTGILISRGSNYFSDLLKKLTSGGELIVDSADVFDPDDVQIMVGDGTDKDEFLNGEEG